MVSYHLKNDIMSSFTIIKSYIQSLVNEKKSREKILQLQNKKFRKIIKFSYKHSSFYQDLYKSKGISEKDLEFIFHYANMEDKKKKRQS